MTSRSTVAKRKVTVLNAFAGFGGCVELLDRNVYQVTHVETNDVRVQYLRDANNGDRVIQTDAWQYILENIMKFDILWASPPCETHSNMRWANRGKHGFTYVYPDMRIYGLIELLRRARKYEPWIVENVEPYYETLIQPTAKVGKHLLWTNFPLMSKRFPSTDHIHIMKDQRDKTNPEIGKYIFESIDTPTLEAWF